MSNVESQMAKEGAKPDGTERLAYRADRQAPGA
jgi:hypothetical protein